jgi:hypothetical protein
MPRAAHLFEVDEGEITRLVYYSDRERACADLGLLPQEPRDPAEKLSPLTLYGGGGGGPWRTIPSSCSTAASRSAGTRGPSEGG